MTWAKLSDNFHSHPKTERMGLDGAGLYAIAISYAACHLTDGFLPEQWVKKQAPAKLVQRLVVIGAWIEVDGGFEIADFLDYNPTKAEVQEKRRVTRERVTRYRSRTNGSSNGAPDPTRPVPGLRMPSVDEEIHKGNGVDVGWFMAYLGDATEGTQGTLEDYRRRLPEAAFHRALEALKERKAATDKEPLVSETRYFVAALKSMVTERQYA